MKIQNTHSSVLTTRFALVAGVFCAATAHAKTFDETEYTNNTSTCVVWQSSDDNVVAVNNGWANRHLYGEMLLLDLYVENVAPEKKIQITQLGVTGSRTEEAQFRRDWFNANAAADWRFTTSDNRDNIWIIKKGNYARGEYRVDVFMNNESHSVFFRLDSCRR